MTTTPRMSIAAALALQIACSTATESTTSSIDEQSDESSSSESSDSAGDEESDPDDGMLSLDGSPLDIPEGNPTESETAESETGEPSHGACCFCAVVSDDGPDESDSTDETETSSDNIIELWCYGWNDTEASCLAWLGENIQTLYDPDCAEAWTDIHDDDWKCDAACF